MCLPEIPTLGILAENCYDSFGGPSMLEESFNQAGIYQYIADKLRYLTL
jgi:hypothetical protein